MNKCWRTLILAMASASAHATATFDPFADVTIDHISNLFAVPAANAVLDPQGTPRLSDVVTTYRAGIDANLLLGEQRFYADVEGRRLRYETFTDLDHNEYSLKAGAAWKVLRVLDGKVDASDSRQIVQFADRTTSVLTYNNDKKLLASVNAAITPVWRLETNAFVHTIASPLENSPDFGLREVSEGGGIKYVGIADISFGVDYQHVRGTYSGEPVAPGYSQNTWDLSVSYVASGLTTFNGAIGYTQRRIEGTAGSAGGTTGLIGYTRQLTGKTSVNMQIARAVNSYYNTGGTELDTSENFSVRWQATYKLSASLGLQHTHSAFQSDSLVVADTLGRTDNNYGATLELRYMPFRWLMVRPHVLRQVRGSSVDQFRYNNSTYGVEFEIRNDKPIG